MRLDAQLWIEQLGLSGILGTGLLCFAAAFHISAVAPVEQRRAALQHEQQRLEALRPAGGSALAQSGPEVGLETFYAQLAAEPAVDELLEKITGMARQRGIVLKQGRYRFAWVGERFGRYEVAFSAQTPYYQARMFIHEVLRELPMVALDDVSFQRTQVAAGGAEMTANFSMLVRRER